MTTTPDSPLNDDDMTAVDTSSYGPDADTTDADADTTDTTDADADTTDTTDADSTDA